jgi:hypothetical protein
MDQSRQIPIWLFIGAILAFYGLLITATGVYHLFSPPSQKVALSEYHADIWWGALLLIIGLVYLVKFWPKCGCQAGSPPTGRPQ